MQILCHFAQAGYDDPFYDYRGSNSFREPHPYQPEERFDPFTGNFYLIYTDVYLPGNAGLDIKIQRVYNSNIYRKDGAQDTPVPDSWVGLGWLLHMGRLVCPATEYKYLEMPDGSKHTFNQDKNDPSQWISKEYWLLQFVSPDKYQVLFTNGIKWTFNMLVYGSIPEPGTSDIFYPTVLISDPFGNAININYQLVVPETFISSISDNLGRTIIFNYSTTGTKTLNSINVNGNYIYYDYQAINADYAELTGVRYPHDPAGYYSYRYEYSTTYPEHELSRVYNPWGGYVTYTYGYNTFNAGGVFYQFRVLTQRQLSSGGNWAISYGLTSGNCDSVCITDPYNTKTSFVMWGYRLVPSTGNNWKLGLMVRKRVSASSANCLWTYAYEPDPPFISYDNCRGPTSWDWDVYVPLLQKREVAIDGKTYTTNYADWDNYGQPKAISEAGDANRSILRTYWYNTSLNIVDRLGSENITYGGSSYVTSYIWNSNGSLAAKNVAGVITNYTYHSDGNLKRVTDASNRWMEYSGYQYGIAKIINKGGVYSINRTINWASTITTETNGRGYQTSFQYDGRNRLTRITPPNTTPTPDPTIIEYHATGDYKKVSMGSSWTTYYYDDWGQVDYTFDRLGRRTFESYPYTSTRLGDTLTYDGLDRVKKITHPDNYYAEYTYYQSKVTYRNERNKFTEFQYRAFGNPFGGNWLGSVKDALNQTTTYAYNAASYLTSISAVTGYNRTYHYDTKYFMDYEISPERGQTNYSYDNAGNLTQRTDDNGSVTVYTYDNVTRLTNIDYPGTSYDGNYYFDKADNCTLMTTPTNTCSLFYDPLNRLTKKKLLIDGYAYTADFTYDSRGNIARITYPDDWYIDYTYDSENRVLTVPGYVNSNITYHPSGREASFTAINGRTTTCTYNNRYWVSNITVNGSVMNESYQYDPVGSLTTLTDNINGANNQSFTYDDIDRLKTFNGPWGNGTYNYTTDYAIGRRYQEIIGANTTTYNYHSTTHRLSNTTGADPYTFTYDDNGNLTGITGRLILTYDYENRPVFINNLESRTTDFVYNAKGERVKKVLGGAIPPKDNQQPEAIAGEQYYYLTGLSREALCEIERYGRIKTYYVYLNSKKLCKVRVTYKYFYHNDYLGSAKAMTDNSGTKIYAWLAILLVNSIASPVPVTTPIASRARNMIIPQASTTSVPDIICRKSGDSLLQIRLWAPVV